ncbi:MAG: hypothetical protein ABGW78_09355 [Pirellulales bacterium]
MANTLDASGMKHALSLVRENQTLSHLRLTLARQTVIWMIGHARLRLTMVCILSMIFWALLFGLFFEGFLFIDSLHDEIMPLLFNAFFASLMAMIVFSSCILTYSGLYMSSEAQLLLTLPVRAESIFFHKFKETLWFSCWGFMLLGSPMLIAYGVVRESFLTYFLLIVPFMISFVLIPATVGSILCILIAAWLARLRFIVIATTAIIGSIVVLWIGWSLVYSANAEGLSASWFETALSQLSVAENPLLPSWWLSSGLLEAARSNNDSTFSYASFLESLKFLGLLFSSGLVLQLVGKHLARSVYRIGYSEIHSEVPTQRRHRVLWLDTVILNTGLSRGKKFRLLLVKDFRIFRRDIAQWSQFVIFFGLLTLYFFNLRFFNYTSAYKSIIGFLNLAVLGLIFSTFTTRFVFPMISLEGRKFWILGLLPLQRDQIVWSKFMFAFFGGLIPCSLLVLLSDCMLKIPLILIILHEFCCIMLCMGLSGIAVGLGARMPNFRETSATKIASGFGGTLSLVLSSVFIVTIVISAAIPFHFFADSLSTGFRQLMSSLFVVSVTGLITTFLPLSIGLRAFRRLEP